MHLGKHPEWHTAPVTQALSLRTWEFRKRWNQVNTHTHKQSQPNRKEQSTVGKNKCELNTGKVNTSGSLFLLKIIPHSWECLQSFSQLHPKGRPVILAALNSISQYEKVTASHLDGDTRIQFPFCRCCSFREVSKNVSLFQKDFSKREDSKEPIHPLSVDHRQPYLCFVSVLQHKPYLTGYRTTSL